MINLDRPGRPAGSAHPLTPLDTIFAANLVDPESGRIAAGHAAWQAAADAIRERILTSAEVRAAELAAVPGGAPGHRAPR